MIASRFQTASPNHRWDWTARDTLLLVVITAIAFLIRLPYWRTIPAAGDETAQATLAMQIARGQALPLTGTDAYTGPAFVYLMAVLYRLGVMDPFLGRSLILGAGTLTVSATYLLMYQLSGQWRPSVLAGALVATNPHQILLSSHPGAATFLMPFFITLFIGLTLKAVDSDSGGTWVLASAMAGLALQANLAAIFPVVGIGLWFAVAARGRSRLGRRWPQWPLLGGLVIGLVCLPIIAYTVQSKLNTVDVLQSRSYLWETNPTLFTYARNLWRLILQIFRQTGGVLGGNESLKDIMGAPALWVGWMVAGWIAVNGRARSLLAAAIVPYLIVVPYFSAHYGILEPVRFTTYMTPLLACGMSLVGERVMVSISSKSPRLGAAGYGAIILLITFPLSSLANHYANVRRDNLGGEVLQNLSAEMIRGNRGERIYVAFSESFMQKVAGIPYVPQAYATAAGLNFDFLPVDQIIGHLFVWQQPAMLLLADEDVARIQQVARLTEWPSATDRQARQRGYGLYILDTTTPLLKPSFVLAGEQARLVKPQFLTHLRVGGLELVGYDAPEHVPPGEPLSLRFYWRAKQALRADTYIGFVHLFSPDGLTLVSQSDRQLGQYTYPVNAWQSDEIVIDEEELSIPASTPAGRYVLRMGVYTWPSLQRLEISSYQDNLFELAPIAIRP